MGSDGLNEVDNKLVENGSAPTLTRSGTKGWSWVYKWKVTSSSGQSLEVQKLHEVNKNLTISLYKKAYNMMINLVFIILKLIGIFFKF